MTEPTSDPGNPGGEPEGAHDASPPDEVVPDETDQVDQDDQADQAAAEVSADERLAERTADLQRLQAEFLNYKRRVERDRQRIAEDAVYRVLEPMLDVLDSIDRAREHGELEGGFKGVAEQLERVVAGLGLVRFGEPGDPFDPTRHDALSHIGTDPDVSMVTCRHVAKAGYLIGDRVMRAAQVLVVDPEETAAVAEPAEEQAPEQEEG